MHFATRQDTNAAEARECSASMAMPVPNPFSGALRLLRAVPGAMVAIALGGCSINLGSLSSSEHDTQAPPPQAAPAATSVSEAQAVTTRAEALARSGNTEEALAEFD